MPPPRLPSAKHPAQTSIAVLYAGAGLLMLLALPFVFAGGAQTRLALVPGGLAVGAVMWSRWLSARVRTVQINNAAVQRLVGGDHDGAKALLETIPRAARRGIVRRTLTFNEALIAMLEGRTRDVERLTTEALTPSFELLPSAAARTQEGRALSLRALARAAAGDAAGATADADRAEQRIETPTDAVARARLARAVLLARGEDRAALRAELAASARLVLEHAMGRERTLFRALQRLARAPARTVYREAARPEPAAREGLHGYVSAIAPDAAPFAAAEAPLTPIADGPESTSARRPRPRQRRGRGRWLLAIALSTIGALLLLQLDVKPTTAGVANEAPAASIMTIWGWLALAVTAILAFGYATRAMAGRRLLRAKRDLLSAETNPSARRALTATAASRSPLVAAPAALELAVLAAKDGRFDEAVARSEGALAALHGSRAAVAAFDLLSPALATEAAVAHAMLGNVDVAREELAGLGRDYPGYAFSATASVRIHLACALRAGDLEDAVAAARARAPAMLLPLREDVAADLALVAAGASSGDDRTRLDEELREDDVTRAWLDATFPGLRGRLGDPARPA